MRPAGSHLTPQELELLLFGAADPGNSNAGSASALEAQQHLSGCAVCQSVAEKYRKADEMLRSLRSGSQGSLNQGSSQNDGNATWDGSQIGRPGSSCPDEQIWLSWAAGLLTEEEAANYVAHAASCKQCSVSLKEAMEDLAYNVTAEEQKALDQLPTASPGWQRQMAMKLAAQQQSRNKTRQGASATDQETSEATQNCDAAALDHEKPVSAKVPPDKIPPADKPGFRWWPKLAWATAALVVVVAAGWFVWLKTREPDVNQLLAQAYTEQRTIELRMPGAKYGPMRVERGGEGSRLNRPPALLDAEATIAHNLARQPEDPHFLQMRGRAELLEWNYDASIETFKHVLDLIPDSLSAKTDLASAYFERAEASNRAIDYGNAIELLGQVLSREPDNKLALFNRAIASERMFLYHDAVNDWKHYIQLDQKGQWADEARKRLEEDRRKIDEHSKAEPLLSPKELIAVVDLGDEASWHAVEQRAEEYLDVAVREWLPKMYSNAKDPEHVIAAALAKLTFILRHNHQDDWLSEMLRGGVSPSMADAAEHLAAAIENNEKGEAEAALRNAKVAASEFLDLNQPAGFARAQIETMYALHRASLGKLCLTTGRKLEKDSSLPHFGWIRSQLMLESAVCARLVSDQGSADTFLKRALTLTSQHRYPGLRLRALSFSASASRLLTADSVTSWKLNYEGLSIFWGGVFPTLRGYSFYQDLAFTAESRTELELLYSLRKESAEMDASMNDTSRHAIAHMLLAKASAFTGRAAEAESELNIAMQNLELLKSSSRNSVYRLFDQIELAQLKGSLGHSQQGIDILRKMEQEVEVLQNRPLQAEFFNTLGDLQRRNGNDAQAKDAFQSALVIGQAGVRSFTNEAEREDWLRTLDSTYRGLVRVELNRHRFEDALEIWEMRSVDADSYLIPQNDKTHASSSSGNGPTASGSPLRNFLPMLRQETVLSYQVLPDGVFIWAYDNRGISYASVSISRTDLERTIRRFGEQCSTPLSDLSSLRQNASKLYKWLVAPIEQKLSPDRALVIELDAGLDEIAMQTLVDESGTYFGQHFPIVYSRNLFEYLNLKHQAGAVDRNSVLVVSPSAPEAAVAQGILPNQDAAREAQSVAEIFPHADVLLGKNVTWPAVQQRLKSASVFHFVGHALAGPDGTRLVFADEQEAGRQIVPASMRLPRSGPLQLVFLSACATAKKNGEGLADPNPLVDIFLRNNVPHVIATQWNVDSAATREFVRAFYLAVNRGEAVGPAAQQAAQTLLRENPTQHPYFWAAFAVFGRG